MCTGAWSKIYDVIGAPNCFLIVFHDEHGVAEVTQRRERLQQFLIISRVKPDGRLVKNV
jgi:hypothetical protein